MNEDQWYFAYGSNLLIDQKVERTGQIRQAVLCCLEGLRAYFFRLPCDRLGFDLRFRTLNTIK